MSRRPRVLVVTGAYSPQLSGGGLQAKVVVDALRGDVDFDVLTTSTDPGLPANDVVDGTRVWRVPVDLTSRASLFLATVRMAAVFARVGRRADIVHLHGFSRKALLVVALARLFGQRIVLTIHTARYDELAHAATLGPFAVWCYRQAHLFTTVSGRLAQNAIDAGLPASRVAVVSNAVDERRFRPATADERRRLRTALGLDPHRVWVLFVAFFSREKAPGVLLDAWLTIRDRLPDSGLVFVGAKRSPYFEVDASLAEELRVRADESCCGDRVRFVEPTASVEDYFRAADLFVMPSLREGFGMVALEAMASGVPVVASRLEGVTDTFIDDGRNGLLVTPGDAPAVAEAMLRVLSDSTLAARLVTGGLDTAQRFSVAAAARRWRELYVSLTEYYRSGHSR
jgi:glycosyltransferase involved in cell wall biosynthesis